MAEILQYVPGNGIFHRLHPFTKIFFIVLVSVVTILTSSITLLAGLLLLIFLLAFASHLLRPVIQQMLLVLVMSIVIYLITILTVEEGTVIGYLVPSFIPVIGESIPITTAALTVGTVLTLRFAILKQLQETGHTIIMITHSREIAEHCADRLVRMEAGRIVADIKGGTLNG
jgi:energy-coupling factor transport system permease protein